MFAHFFKMPKPHGSLWQLGKFGGKFPEIPGKLADFPCSLNLSREGYSAFFQNESDGKGGLMAQSKKNPDKSKAHFLLCLSCRVIVAYPGGIDVVCPSCGKVMTPQSLWGLYGSESEIGQFKNPLRSAMHLNQVLLSQTDYREAVGEGFPLFLDCRSPADSQAMESVLVKRIATLESRLTEALDRQARLADRVQQLEQQAHADEQEQIELLGTVFDRLEADQAVIVEQTARLKELTSNWTKEAGAEGNNVG